MKRSLITQLVNLQSSVGNGGSSLRLQDPATGPYVSQPNPFHSYPVYFKFSSNILVSSPGLLKWSRRVQLKCDGTGGEVKGKLAN